VGCGTVAAHQDAASGQAVAHRDLTQAGIPRLAGGVENDADVHHDVNEQRLFGYERAQVLAFLAEAQREGASRLDDDIPGGGFAGKVVPAAKGGHEDEAEVVHIAVVLARLERLGIAQRLLEPPGCFRTAGRVPLVEDPHHAGQKPVAPAGPGGQIVAPAPPVGVHGVEIGLALDEAANLLFGKLQRVFEEGPVMSTFQANHGFSFSILELVFHNMVNPRGSCRREARARRSAVPGRREAGSSNNNVVRRSGGR